MPRKRYGAPNYEPLTPKPDAKTQGQTRRRPCRLRSATTRRCAHLSKMMSLTHETLFCIAMVPSADCWRVVGAPGTLSHSLALSLSDTHSLSHTHTLSLSHTLPLTFSFAHSLSFPGALALNVDKWPRLLTIGRFPGAARQGLWPRGTPAPYTHTPHPTPYTLHPTPYTPHPTPYTPHPTPYTPHPTPYTSHPTRHTSHPTPHTPHPTTYTLHTNPLTLNLKR